MARYFSPWLVLGLAAAALTGCSSDESLAADNIACAPVKGSPRTIPEAKLYFEYQSRDNDTGIHGLFDASGWSELCVIGPDGRRFLATKPQGNLRTFNMAGIFFESREPKASEVSQQEVLALFPAGDYQIQGVATSGESLTGSAKLTHDIPAAAAITAPTEDEMVDPTALVIRWDPVTQTVSGQPVTISGYEIIVTNESKAGADPHGMSQPIASIHVVPTVHELSIPPEFLEPKTRYEVEVIAIETSGNQTISVLFFETP
jgi:hypothetical protein